MPTETFIETARLNGEFRSDEEAHETTIAVLETLGEAISRGEATDLSEKLPAEFSDALLEAAADAEVPEAPSVDEFFDRIADRAGIDRAEAPDKVQGVMVALAETAGDEYDDVRAQLPPAYDEVFEPARALRRQPFERAVQKRAGLDSEPEALDVTRAVLTALGERLSRGEAEDLAVYLPSDVEDAILEDRLETDYSAEEFVERVAELGKWEEETAREYAEAVLTTLAEVAREEEIQRALDQLPSGYDDLLAAA